MSADDVTTTTGQQSTTAEELDAAAQGEALRAQVAELKDRLAERTEDLQRLQAEYVNYKKRVDRDRDLARRGGVEKVLGELLPVLDAIRLADEHGQLDGPVKVLADQVLALTTRHGMTSFGEVGDAFDPALHEALMQQPLPGATQTCVSQVMQPGHRIDDKVLRPARVAVSDPDPEATTHDDLTGQEDR